MYCLFLIFFESFAFFTLQRTLIRSLYSCESPLPHVHGNCFTLPFWHSLEMGREEGVERVQISELGGGEAQHAAREHRSCSLQFESLICQCGSLFRLRADRRVAGRTGEQRGNNFPSSPFPALPTQKFCTKPMKSID